MVSPVRKMVASTKENLAKATANTGQTKVKALNTEKLFQQQPTFYNFDKVFGQAELSHQRNQVNKVLHQARTSNGSLKNRAPQALFLD